MPEDETARPGPYEGLRVVEVADNPAGELAGKLLADMGADVVKIELPDGSPTRRIGPFLADRVDVEASLTFRYYNTSKRSVVIDWATPAGLAQMLEVASRADVVITTLTPRLYRRCFEDTGFRDANPGAIVVSITAFGLDGPWVDLHASELVSLALGGPLNSCGYDDLSLPPILPGGNQASHTAASFAHTSLLLALIHRELHGAGQLVDVSVHESLAVTVEMANPYWTYNRTLVRRQTCRHAQPMLTQSSLFECGDGRYIYLLLVVSKDKAWKILVEWFQTRGMAVDLVDERYGQVEYRQENYPHIQEVMECFALLSDAETLYREGQERGLPCGIVYAPEDLLQDRHLRQRGFFVACPPEAGADDTSALYPGAPYRFSSFEWALQSRAPHLGEHSIDVLGPQADRPEVAR